MQIKISGTKKLHYLKNHEAPKVNELYINWFKVIFWYFASIAVNLSRNRVTSVVGFEKF